MATSFSLSFVTAAATSAAGSTTRSSFPLYLDPTEMREPTPAQIEAARRKPSGGGLSYTHGPSRYFAVDSVRIHGDVFVDAGVAVTTVKTRIRQQPLEGNENIPSSLQCFLNYYAIDRRGDGEGNETGPSWMLSPLLSNRYRGNRTSATHQETYDLSYMERKELFVYNYQFDIPENAFVTGYSVTYTLPGDGSEADADDPPGRNASSADGDEEGKGDDGEGEEDTYTMQVVPLATPFPSPFASSFNTTSTSSTSSTTSSVVMIGNTSSKPSALFTNAIYQPLAEGESYRRPVDGGDAGTGSSSGSGTMDSPFLIGHSNTTVIDPWLSLLTTTSPTASQSHSSSSVASGSDSSNNTISTSSSTMTRQNQQQRQRQRQRQQQQQQEEKKKNPDAFTWVITGTPLVAFRGMKLFTASLPFFLCETATVTLQYTEVLKGRHHDQEYTLSDDDDGSDDDDDEDGDGGGSATTTTTKTSTTKASTNDNSTSATVGVGVRYRRPTARRATRRLKATTTNTESMQYTMALSTLLPQPTTDTFHASVDFHSSFDNNNNNSKSSSTKTTTVLVPPHPSSSSSSPVGSSNNDSVKRNNGNNISSISSPHQQQQQHQIALTERHERDCALVSHEHFSTTSPSSTPPSHHEVVQIPGVISPFGVTGGLGSEAPNPWSAESRGKTGWTGGRRQAGEPRGPGLEPNDHLSVGGNKTRDTKFRRWEFNALSSSASASSSSSFSSSSTTSVHHHQPKMGLRESITFSVSTTHTRVLEEVITTIVTNSNSTDETRRRTTRQQEEEQQQQKKQPVDVTNILLRSEDKNPLNSLLFGTTATFPDWTTTAPAPAATSRFMVATRQNSQSLEQQCEKFPELCYLSQLNGFNVNVNRAAAARRNDDDQERSVRVGAEDKANTCFIHQWAPPPLKRLMTKTSEGGGTEAVTTSTSATASAEEGTKSHHHLSQQQSSAAAPAPLPKVVTFTVDVSPYSDHGGGGNVEGGGGGSQRKTSKISSGGLTGLTLSMKTAMKQMVKELLPHDWFNIVTFDASAAGAGGENSPHLAYNQHISSGDTQHHQYVKFWPSSYNAVTSATVDDNGVNISNQQQKQHNNKNRRFMCTSPETSIFLPATAQNKELAREWLASLRSTVGHGQQKRQNTAAADTATSATPSASSSDVNSPPGLERIRRFGGQVVTEALRDGLHSLQHRRGLFPIVGHHGNESEQEEEEELMTAPQALDGYMKYGETNLYMQLLFTHVSPTIGFNSLVMERDASELRDEAGVGVDSGSSSTERQQQTSGDTGGGGNRVGGWLGNSFNWQQKEGVLRNFTNDNLYTDTVITTTGSRRNKSRHARHLNDRVHLFSFLFVGQGGSPTALYPTGSTFTGSSSSGSQSNSNVALSYPEVFLKRSHRAVAAAAAETMYWNPSVIGSGNTDGSAVRLPSDHHSQHAGADGSMYYTNKNLLDVQFMDTLSRTNGGRSFVIYLDRRQDTDRQLYRAWRSISTPIARHVRFAEGLSTDAEYTTAGPFFPQSTVSTSSASGAGGDDASSFAIDSTLQGYHYSSQKGASWYQDKWGEKFACVGRGELNSSSSSSLASAIVGPVNDMALCVDVNQSTTLNWRSNALLGGTPQYYSLVFSSSSSMPSGDDEPRQSASSSPSSSRSHSSSTSTESIRYVGTTELLSLMTTPYPTSPGVVISDTESGGIFIDPKAFNGGSDGGDGDDDEKQAAASVSFEMSTMMLPSSSGDGANHSSHHNNMAARPYYGHTVTVNELFSSTSSSSSTSHADDGSTAAAAAAATAAASSRMYQPESEIEKEVFYQSCRIAHSFERVQSLKELALRRRMLAAIITSDTDTDSSTSTSTTTNNNNQNTLTDPLFIDNMSTVTAVQDEARRIAASKGWWMEGLTTPRLVSTPHFGGSSFNIEAIARGGATHTRQYQQQQPTTDQHLSPRTSARTRRATIMSRYASVFMTPFILTRDAIDDILASPIVEHQLASDASGGGAGSPFFVPGDDTSAFETAKAALQISVGSSATPLLLRLLPSSSSPIILFLVFVLVSLS